MHSIKFLFETIYGLEDAVLKNIKMLLISDIWMEWFDFFSVSMLHYESLYISVQDNIWLEEVVWKIQRMLFSAWPSFESE